MPNAEFIFPVVKDGRTGGASIRFRPATGYWDLKSEVNIANLGLQTVETLAAQLLRKDLESSHAWWVSTTGTIHKKDLDGDSAQLAALLAFFADSYHVVPDLDEKAIWCTGRVSPHLEIRRVDRETFVKKLTTFVEGRGRLFIAPRANCVAAEEAIQASGLAKISVDDLLKGKPFPTEQPTLLEAPVGRRGLATLLQVLFEASAPAELVLEWQGPPRWQGWLIPLSILAVGILVAGGFLYRDCGSISRGHNPADIMPLLGNPWATEPISRYSTPHGWYRMMTIPRTTKTKTTSENRDRSWCG